MSIHRFYIDPDDIDGTSATITGQDARHLVNVLRLGIRDRVELADGCGNQYLSEIESVSSKKVILKIMEKKFLDVESPAHITIAQGVLKDKKMDVILRHLTELGIKEWIPFFAARSVPCPDLSDSKKTDIAVPIKSGTGRKSFDARVERWEKIAKESIKQCGRSFLPIIHPPTSFEEMIRHSDSYDEKITFWERATTPFDDIRKRANSVFNSENRVENLKIIVMIGPEGGFSEHEVELAQKHGFRSFSLGSRILRAETASIAASTLVQNIFGDLGRKPLTHSGI